MNPEIDRNYSLVNATDYQSTQALTRTQEIFDSKLKALVSSNVTEHIDQLEDVFTHL